MFEFTPTFLLTIIHDRYYTVPLYQRSYSWTTDEVRDFWNDSVRAIEDGGEYFLGTIVLSEESEPGTYSIIDGQQRIATTTILLSAMRDAYRDNGEEDNARRVQDQSITTYDMEIYETKPRIRLNAIDNDFYLKRIIHGNDVQPETESHGRIEEAYKTLRSLLDEIVSSHPDTWKAEFGKVRAFLNKQARIVVVKASNDSDAFIIFETLNDRGADLTISDLLKNYLFSRAATELHSVQQYWVEANTILAEHQEEKEFVTFLRHLWSSYYGATRERDLYRDIKTKITKKDEAVKLAKSIRDGARLYGAILSSDADFWKEYDERTRNLISPS